MIINVKSFMAAVMAAIIVLAVVVPITSAMVGVAGQKVMSDNELTDDEYRMTRSAASAAPRITVTDTDDLTELLIGGESYPLHTRVKICADTFTMDFENTFKFLNGAQTEGDPVYTPQDGDYVVIESGVWTIYTTAEQQGNSKTDRDWSPRDFDDPDAKASLLQRVPAANKELFSAKELETLAKEGVDILRAATVHSTGTFTWIVYPDDAGSLYNAKARGVVPNYVDSGSTIYCSGSSAFANGPALIMGTLSSLEVVFSKYPIAQSDIECHYTPTAYSNEFTDIVYTDGNGDTYDDISIIAPLKYTSNVDAGLAGTLVSLVPVVLIVGLIIGLVSVWFLRRGGEEF